MYLAETGPVPHSIVGVVGDVKRDMDGHHYAEVEREGVKIDFTYRLN